MRKVLLFLLLFVSAAGAEEKSVYRFVYVGCNRVGFEVDIAKNPSTANVQQLKNTFREVARMDPRPTHFFLVGDLILGYTSWLNTVDQLKAWRSLYQKSPLARSGITLVPIMGNHEALLSHQDPTSKEWTDYPNPPAVKAWKYVMKPLLRWKDGPAKEAPNLDQVMLDESDLSFSVVDGKVMFICLNTDTFVDNVITGDIPLHWLESKLKQGQESPEIEHIFVLGHKTLVMPDLPAWIVREEEREPAIELLTRHSKVRAFLTAHYHLWDYRLMPGGVPQIIAGNGGSPLKGSFLEPGVGYFGYTVVDIMESGKIVVESWGRPVPEPYSSDLPQPKATLRERKVLPTR